MADVKTERSNCRFVVQQTKDGKSLLIIERYQDTIEVLRNLALGFDLLGGIRPEQAKKVADLLNEHVLSLVVMAEEKRAEH